MKTISVFPRRHKMSGAKSGKDSKDTNKAAKKALRVALDGHEKERKLKQKAALSDAEGKPKNVLADFAPFAKFDRNGLEVDILHTSMEDASWNEDIEKFIFDLTKSNMHDLYVAAPDWGWNDKKKKAELFSSEMRFLIAKQRSDGAPIGFVAFTFVLEEEYDALYVFELQLTNEAQRKGLGRHLMQIMELAARKNSFQWCVVSHLHEQFLR